METDNHEIRDKIIITTSGLIGSKRIKKENIEEDSVYFGYKEPKEEIVKKYKYIIFNIGWGN